MRVITGTVVGGKVELPPEMVEEGAQVTALVSGPNEPIRLSPAEESVLLEAMEEIRRGEYVDGGELLSELRSRPQA